MKPESEWNLRIAPLPWRRGIIGENDFDDPICVVLDANGVNVCEYLTVGDADLIVAAVNKYQP